jgi:hypothetical protein
VHAEKLQSSIECNERETYCGTFKEVTKLVCSCLSEMGDSSLVLQIVEKVLLEQIVLKPALDNGCAILRMICVLDSTPTTLSERSVTTLSEFLPGYMINIVNVSISPLKTLQGPKCFIIILGLTHLLRSSCSVYQRIRRTLTFTYKHVSTI